MLAGKTFQQRIGIPMGTNPAVFFANFFLFSFELEFATRIIASHCPYHLKVLRSFANCTQRYIDDILVLNNPLFPKYAVYKQDGGDISDEMAPSKWGLYPEYLTLNLEQGSSTSIHFLDVFIFFNRRSNRLESTIYSKANDPKYAKLQFIRYPHISSLLATNCKYNV